MLNEMLKEVDSLIITPLFSEATLLEIALLAFHLTYQVASYRDENTIYSIIPLLLIIKVSNKLIFKLAEGYAFRSIMIFCSSGY